MTAKPPTVLAESWMPIDKIGAECMRERGASSALPPLYFLHIWWARRPLVVCRAAILGSLLPSWDEGWPRQLLARFPSEESYREWFVRLLGILGDPVAGRKLISWAKAQGIKLDRSPYGYKRAFTRSPDVEQLAVLGDLLDYSWGTRDLSVCDPMSGGGSIPFEALRYGFRTYANELNPVASVILKATLDYPARYGPGFAGEIRKWGGELARRVNARLDPFFPKQLGEESIHAYIWARTVACPITGKPVPLSPNWWLQKGTDPIAVRLIAKSSMDVCEFEVVKGSAALDAKPDEGTVKRGVGRSPWSGDAVDGDYIKSEARAGRMGQQLYAIGTKKGSKFVFRQPTDEDLDAVSEAEKELARRLPELEVQGVVPREGFPQQSTDPRPLYYGMPTWGDFFAPRQLLSLVTFVEELRAMQGEIEKQCGKEKAAALQTYLALAVDKAADYNSRMTVWHPSRTVIAHAFARHDFSFKWSHGEFDAAGNLLPWVVGQVADAYAGIAKLSHKEIGLSGLGGTATLPLELTKGSAASMSGIADGTIHLLCVDPPYHDNVMYAECSDFFYVWLKRTVGDIFPGWFDDELTNKDDEAVANHSRFEGAKKKRELATADYERKMAACFREMHRVLRPDGVLTVMFTHKKVEAWDTLAGSLIGAGFSIQTSWPVRTESEHSLHQAKKNAAASTILLVCRKRGADKEPVWWDDLKGQVREEARSKAREFHAQGISGVDLYISAFGPVLSILSRNWPVLSTETDAHGHPLPLRPEVALDLAREEVIALRKEELLLGRKVQFDPVTDWYLMAWDAFGAEQFPGDEARKLALVLGLELEADIVKTKRLATKKGADVILQLPKARRKKGMVDPDVEVFDCLLDAVHTAMLIYDEDGSRACASFLKRTGLLGDSSFKLALQAMLNAIPRTRAKDGSFIRPEARILDDLRLKFFDDLTTPPEEEPPKAVPQTDMFEPVGDNGDKEEDEGDED